MNVAQQLTKTKLKLGELHDQALKHIYLDKHMTYVKIYNDGFQTRIIGKLQRNGIRKVTTEKNREKNGKFFANNKDLQEVIQ